MPLKEIISEILQVGTSSKRVCFEYDRVIEKLGPELHILQEIPLNKISEFSSLLGEAITRLRAEKVIKKSGYDGEYGVIKLFEEGEIKQKYNSL